MKTQEIFIDCIFEGDVKIGDAVAFTGKHKNGKPICAKVKDAVNFVTDVHKDIARVDITNN